MSVISSKADMKMLKFISPVSFLGFHFWNVIKNEVKLLKQWNSKHFKWGFRTTQEMKDLSDYSKCKKYAEFTIDNNSMHY